MKLKTFKRKTGFSDPVIVLKKLFQTGKYLENISSFLSELDLYFREKIESGNFFKDEFEILTYFLKELKVVTNDISSKEYNLIEIYKKRDEFLQKLKAEKKY